MLVKQLEGELVALKEDNDLKKDLEFKDKLEALIQEYGVSKEFVLKVVNPEAHIEGKKTRKQRKLKIYTNPHTGEVVKTRGGNQRMVKLWKKEHGSDTVEGWVVEEGEHAEKAPEAKQEATAPVETKPKATPKATTKAPKATQKKTQARKKPELPIGMKPAPKSTKTPFKFVPSAKR